MTSSELEARDGGEEKLPPLRSNARFRLLWGGSALSVMAERSSTMAFTLLVLWHTGSKSAAGLVGFSALLPMLVMQLPAGVLVDRWDRRRVMLVCVAGRALAIGSVAVSLAGDEVRVWHIAIVAFVQGSLTVFYQLSERAAVRGVVPPQQVSTAMAQNEARSRAVNFVGHPASGVLFGLSAWVPFLSSTGLYLMSLLTLARLRIPHKKRSGKVKSARGMREEISSGLRWVWQRAYFRSALLIIAGSNLVFQGLILTVAVMVREQGRPASTVGLIMAAGSIGGLLGAFSGGWLSSRLPMRRVMMYAHVAWALIMPGTVFLLHPVTLGILFFITSHIGAAVTVSGMSHQVRITPDAMQGRVGSVVMLLVSGASSLGALGTGYLLEGVGTRGTLAIASGVMALLAVVATVVFTRPGAEREDRSAQDEASGPQRELTAGPPTTMTLRRIDG
ncbi:MFS transporter [Streptomyces albiflavescens]|uniref:MFS transporter n=1 Tax=Streptomyces albiflavescens TaxID=1623582 RepID=A0A917XT91_9ACTN|nr:MFS transporter [Streptomyces albiflavescens]GGN50248.1 MFS transporter [Streptomyces albiflavescens]